MANQAFSIQGRFFISNPLTFKQEASLTWTKDFIFFKSNRVIDVF
jgi:hypothetical protein